MGSAGKGDVNAKNGRAKLTKAFRCKFSGAALINLNNSIHERAETNAVVVIIAGTILPLIRRVSSVSTGIIP
jgi:hypothetical protein